MIKALFFDLDGTLLPMNEGEFANYYFGLLFNKMTKYGYDDKELFVKTIWGGVKAMYLNDGKVSNEDVFFNYFKSVYGEKVADDKPIFLDFYKNEFKDSIKMCGKNDEAKSVIKYARDHFKYVVLSTNPIFPMVATETRMGFVGLNKDDFDFVTSYENSCYTKPNPKYFMEILKKFNLDPSEVVLFGNNTLEDYYCATSIGIKTYLVGDCIIHNKNVEEKGIPYIKLGELLETIKKLEDE